MKTFQSLKEAQEASEQGTSFIEIRRIKDDEWVAYETVEELIAAGE